MADLYQARCFNHAAREAVARCPACKKFFCRECVTEHNGRILCAACIQNIEVPALGKTNSALKPAVEKCARLAKGIVGMLLLWIFFYAIGQLLLLIPDSFHTGDLWRQE